jgi:hypothetical protein
MYIYIYAATTRHAHIHNRPPDQPNETPAATTRHAPIHNQPPDQPNETPAGVSRPLQTASLQGSGDPCSHHPPRTHPQPTARLSGRLLSDFSPIRQNTNFVQTRVYPGLCETHIYINTMTNTHSREYGLTACSYDIFMYIYIYVYIYICEDVCGYANWNSLPVVFLPHFMAVVCTTLVGSSPFCQSLCRQATLCKLMSTSKTEAVCTTTH